jgi:hypothetical protein
MIQVHGIHGDGDDQEMMIKCSNLEKNPIEMVRVANVWVDLSALRCGFAFNRVVI